MARSGPSCVSAVSSVAFGRAFPSPERPQSALGVGDRFGVEVRIRDVLEVSGGFRTTRGSSS